VDIVFNGHSHHYEHIVRDGITYLLVGGGGATPRHTAPIHIEGSDVSIEGHHFYIRVEASVDAIDVACLSVAEEIGGEPVPTPGQIMDRFTLYVESPNERAMAVPPTNIPIWMWIALGVAGAALVSLLARMLDR